jgi:membrane fusion protein, multidrug efflux system
MQKSHKMMINLNKKLAAICLCIVLAGLLLNSSCAKKKAPPKQIPLVLATPVVQKTVPIEIKNFGSVEPFATISVKSQIKGILTDVNFIQGQMVNKNDVILGIDSRPSQAALKQAIANLNKDEVQLKNAEKELQRQAELLKKGFVSQELYDQAVTTADSFRASIEADRAAVESAKLQLEYCTIKSPVDGITGVLAVDKGNVIKENDATIVVIKQVKPIYVNFTVPQKYLSQIQKYMAANPLAVTASADESDANDSTGTLSFVDNAVDNNAGMIRLRATFDNKDTRLWPGQYVNVGLVLTNEPNALVVPSQAVQTSQKGQFVYVVKPDMTVEQRPVTVERRLDGESVLKGVDAGETVVTDGQINLVPGATVQIKDAEQK